MSDLLFPVEHKPMELRWYQNEAITGFYNYLRDPGNQGRNPIIVIPTGGGKTPVISRIINDVAGKKRGFSATRWNHNNWIAEKPRLFLESSMTLQERSGSAFGWLRLSRN